MTCEKRATHAILTHALLEVSDDVLTIDCDRSRRHVRTAVTVRRGRGRDGSTTVNVKRLLDMLKTVNAKSDCNARDRRARDSRHVRKHGCHHPHAAVDGLSDVSRGRRTGQRCTIAYSALRTLIGPYTLRRVDRGDASTAPGALLKPSRRSRVEMVATDGHRLAVAHAERRPHNGRTHGRQAVLACLLIPSKALDLGSEDGSGEGCRDHVPDWH